MFNYGQPFTHIRHAGFDLAHQRTAQRLQRCGQRLGPLASTRATSGTTSAGSPGPRTTARSTRRSHTSPVPSNIPAFISSSTVIQPTGVQVTPPRMSGRREPALRRQRPDHRHDRLELQMVRQAHPGRRIRHVVRGQRPVPGADHADRPLRHHKATWYALGNWFLYQFCDKSPASGGRKCSATTRASAPAFSDNFYEMTLGLIYKPKALALDPAGSALRLGAVHQSVQRWDPRTAS